MRRAQKLKVQAIQKEQVQLVKIEKSLEDLLDNVNESINSLKVEELQLKSCLVEHFTNVHFADEEEKPMTSAQAALNTTATSWLKSDHGGVSSVMTADDGLMDDSINKQLMDLETLLVPMKTRVFGHEEEEEEEDDEQMVPYRHAVFEEEMDEDDEEFLPE